MELCDRTGVICPGYEDGRLFERSAGIAAMAGSDWDLAETHFRSALDLTRTLPHPIEAAHTRRWWGWMLLERNALADAAAAAALLAAAAESYQRMGMPRHRQMCLDGPRVHAHSA